MNDLEVKTKKVAKTGATTGLARRSGITAQGTVGPEQIYVSVTEDLDRPILLEGWVGYAVPACVQLTRQQAEDLVPLLQEALRVRSYIAAAR